MIPKIIHFTWFSNDPYPEKIKQCMSTWYEFLPDYKFMHWDLTKIKDIKNPFLEEALEMKKWAFASDYIRLYALHKYGGIYLDTDVILYQSLDSLLEDNFFIGKENSIHIEGNQTDRYLTSHCMGCISGHPYVKKCLDYYLDRHFILSRDRELPENLRLDMTLLPFIQSELAKQYGYKASPLVKIIQQLQIEEDFEMTIYPTEYFDAIKVTKNTYCKHLAAGSWRTSKRKYEKINFKYKINWRIRFFFEFILRQFGYLMIKMSKE